MAGCSGDENTDLYQKLAERYAPVLRFHEGERFFPVDMESHINNATLYGTGSPYYEIKLNETERSEVFRLLTNATDDNFTTVTSSIDNDSDPQKITPNIEEIYNLYNSGQIKSRLTIYATVCRVKDMPNFDLIKQLQPKEKRIIDPDNGVILNYYFFFPALESIDYMRECDWSGISLIFSPIPDKDQLDKNPPILTCYYNKIYPGVGEKIDYFNSEPDGFSRWEDNKLQKIEDPVTGLKTHPVVYISYGRHNCYFTAKDANISPHYIDNSLHEKIEKGAYPFNPNPSNVLIGGNHEMSDGTKVIIAIMPWMIFFWACGATCEFDSSGIAPDDPNVTDEVNDKGHEATPEKGSIQDYPTPAPATGKKQLKMDLVYVDLKNEEYLAYWSYNGFWGVIRQDKYSNSAWGNFKSVKRPNLGPWLLWNLFLDPIYGSNGRRYVDL